MIDRTKQPEFKNIDQIVFPLIEKRVLDNSVELYSVKSGTQDILKIDVLFDTFHAPAGNPLIAPTVNKMLIEGTHTLSSQEIAEKMDYYGAFIQLSPTKDAGIITLHTLRKYLPQTLEILFDIVSQPAFTEHELNIYLKTKRQKFLVELEKVSEIARREFNGQIFGNNHPYGLNIVDDHFQQIKPSDLKEFHHSYYGPANCKILISGKVEEGDINTIAVFFGDKAWSRGQKNNCMLIPGEWTKKESFIEKKNATQSAIRIGKITIPKTHPDYHSLEITNTILGGYFGSRLMKTIREEKGYTYGINSVLVNLKNAGFFVILTEVGGKYTLPAIEAIFEEIIKLRKETVSKEELDLVRNYMTGELLRSFDGPIELSASYRTLIENGLDIDYYRKKFNVIQSIGPEQVFEVANKYLHEDSFIKTVAGIYQ